MDELVHTRIICVCTKNSFAQANEIVDIPTLLGIPAGAPGLSGLAASDTQRQEAESTRTEAEEARTEAEQERQEIETSRKQAGRPYSRINQVAGPLFDVSNPHKSDRLGTTEIVTD
mgnify:CR=1 FL=1